MTTDSHELTDAGVNAIKARVHDNWNPSEGADALYRAAIRAAFAAGRASVPSGEPVAWMYSWEGVRRELKFGPGYFTEGSPPTITPLYAATGVTK